MLAVWGLAARLLSRPGQLQANVMVGPVLTHQKSPLPAKQWLPGLIRITHPRDRLSRCCGVHVRDAELNEAGRLATQYQLADDYHPGLHE
jgi:hypothetical protein